METTTQNKTWVEPDWEFLDWAWNVERQWKQSLRESYPRTDAELLRVFSPPKETLQQKVDEWGESRNKVVGIIKNKLTIIKTKTNDESSRWFWREWVKLNEGVELLKIDNHISRLKRMLFILTGRTPKSRVTDEMIQQALSVPIESLFSKQLRRSGSKLVALCPLHNEKTPSFFIYSDSNTFYCYGCNQGGNAINFTRLLHELDFISAVKLLTNQ